jgi:FMN reductase
VTTRSLAVVTAGLRQPSSTRLLADRLTEAVVRELDALGVETRVHVVELRELAHEVTDHLLTGFAPPRLDAAIRSVTGADGLVAVTPVFTGSSSGLFKSFFDVHGKDSIQGLPVLAAATAGTARHSLVLDHALRPMFTYLRAVVVPTGVFAATEDWGTAGQVVATSGLGDRIDRAARELAPLVAAGRAVRPGDELADPIPFERLLGGR